MRALLAALLALSFVAARPAPAQEPDYGVWNSLLARYYDPARGMDYAALKARDGATLQNLRNALGRVNVAALDRRQQLAYWINVYNVNVVATIVEAYPVASIRDLSTDPLIRLNVFKKERVPFGARRLSLDEVENGMIRERFHDPRIHFAINCAARSCPPIRKEAYSGARLDAQLDDQARKFVDTFRFGWKGETLVVHATKILDWFADDFERWGGGRTAFVRRYLTPEKSRLFDRAREVELVFDDYDWALNDWRR